jgi:hypothetical protein
VAEVSNAAFFKLKSAKRKIVGKARSWDKRREAFHPVTLGGRDSEKSLPPEIREANLRSSRRARLDDLRRQILSGTYCTTAQEIGAAIIDKHLKR